VSRPGNRYWQVWQDWRRWMIFRALVWTMAVWWLLYLLDMYLRSQPVFNTSGYPMRYGAIPSVYWQFLNLIDFPVPVISVLLTAAAPIMLVWHVKTQMKNWRAALMPRFRLPHLLMSAVIGVAMFLAMVCAPAALEITQRSLDLVGWGQRPFIVLPPSPGHLDEWIQMRRSIAANATDQARWQSREAERRMQDWAAGAGASLVCQAIYGAATILLFAAAAGWLTAFLSLGFAIAAIVLVSIGVGWIGGIAGLRDIMWVIEGDLYLSLRLLALGALLLVGLWLRLGRLAGADVTVSADERVPWLSRIIVGSAPLPAGGLATASLWQRVVHRRFIGLGHRFVWIVAIFLAAMISLSPLLGGDANRWLTNNGYAFAGLCVAGVVSALAIGLSWPQRFADLREVELLRPAARQAFAREIGLAMMCDAVEITLATILAMLIPIAFWSPTSFSSGPFWSALAATILCQALVFGAMTWTMRRLSTAASMAALLVTIILLTVLIDQALDNRMLIASFAAAAVGIALATDAYHRWIRHDMI
jgi:hypothetical protein